MLEGRQHQIAGWGRIEESSPAAVRAIQCRGSTALVQPGFMGFINQPTITKLRRWRPSLNCKNDRQHSSPSLFTLLPFLYWFLVPVFLPIGWANELILFLFSSPVCSFFKWIYNVGTAAIHETMNASSRKCVVLFSAPVCRKCVLPSESIICRRKCVLANPMEVCIHRSWPKSRPCGSFSASTCVWVHSCKSL